jgi:Ca2+-binding RTX toxin-like protein
MSRSLRLEALEAKITPAGGLPTPVGISLNPFGVLHIKGDDHDDVATVTVENGQIHAIQKHRVPNPVDGLPPILLPFQDKLFTLAQVKSISFFGASGNDSFTNDTAIKSTGLGGDGDDLLVGGSNKDLLSGGNGNDTLEGRASSDDLRGGYDDDTFVFTPIAGSFGLGSDRITESANRDTDVLDFSGFPKVLGSGITVQLTTPSIQIVKTGMLSLTLSDALGIEDVIGTFGDDYVQGNDRPNHIVGDEGNDHLVGLGGADRLYGESGLDLLSGGIGNDTLDGGTGSDRIITGVGNNSVVDGSGDDLVDFQGNSVGVNYTTSGGNDTVIGTNYADKITGSSGNDRLEGGFGDDNLSGGLGNDVLIGGPGKNVINDGSGNDTVDFSGNATAITYTTTGGNDKVIGSKYNDKITGSSGNDSLYGGAGNDQLFGKGGTDEVYGQAGNDWLEAGSVSEVADGGDGTDYNAYRWAINGATYDDVKQGGIGSCVFLSGLSSAAAQGMDLASRISYLGNFTYNVKLYNVETQAIDNREVVFNGFIYTKPDGTRIDPWQADPEEFWTILYQRAYVQMANYADLDFTDPDDAMYAVTGRSVDTGDWSDPTVVKNALADDKVVTAGNADDTYKVYAHHSYTVLDVYQQSGTWYIKLRNPWGKDVKSSDLADGSHVAYGSNNDGIIVLTWSSFQGYHDFDRISIS